MKIETGFGGGWLGGIAEQVQTLEARGFDSIVVPETKHNSLFQMMIAAEHTERVEISSSVTIAFPRTPMIMAQAAWDLQQFSKGRINLGLGSQVKGHNVRRFGGTWAPPAKRMEDYINMMRAVWHSWQTGERPEFISDNYTYTLMTPMFDPGPIEYDPPKISLANVGPLMAQTAGACADGLRPHGFMTHKVMMETVIPNVKKGADRAGRSLDDIDFSVGGFLAFGETESEVEQSIDSLRRAISFYGSTRSYHGVFRAHGLESLGMQLHELSLKGEWDKMHEAVNFEVAAEMAHATTWDELPKYVRDNLGYASRISLGQYARQAEDGGRSSFGYPGSRDESKSAGLSEERLTWLMDELKPLGANPSAS